MQTAKRVAWRDLHFFDHLGERYPIVFVKQFEHLDVGQEIRVARHGGSA
jgi:hypothetical protein